LTELATQVAQRKVQQALEAFAAADTESAESMLRPLKLLAIGGKGGQVLWVSPAPETACQLPDDPHACRY
jgi:hypothetical protein